MPGLAAAVQCTHGEVSASQNHRPVWVGMDLKGYLIPTPSVGSFNIAATERDLWFPGSGPSPPSPGCERNQLCPVNTGCASALGLRWVLVPGEGRRGCPHGSWGLQGWHWPREKMCSPCNPAAIPSTSREASGRTGIGIF